MDNNTNNANTNGSNAGKYTWGVIVGIIIVVLIIVLVMHNRNQAASAVPATTEAPDASALTATPSPVEDTSAGSIDAPTATASGTTASPAAPISYTNALALYANKRIQFDTTCTAIPNTETFPNNTVLMLDNRSPDNRTIHLGSMGTITIAAWSFKLVNFTVGTVPSAIIIDCDQMQNVGTVILQK